MMSVVMPHFICLHSFFQPAVYKAENIIIKPSCEFKMTQAWDCGFTAVDDFFFFFF